MAGGLPGLIESLRSRRALRRWRHAADTGGTVEAPVLAALAPRAREVALHARRLAEAADARLGGPRIGEAIIARPAQCDWAWRPAPWASALVPQAVAGATDGTRLAEGVTLFHDCPLAEITLRQTRATDPARPAPFSLALDALGFRGSFLSLALDLPASGATTLRSGHIVIVSTVLRMERQAEMFVRLNLRQGPNTERMTSALRPADGPDRPDGPATAEFDLGFHEVNPAKLEAAWIDLIFGRPAMNLVSVEDLTVTRRPRADI